MSVWVWVALAVAAASLLILIYALLRAPDGYEDETGFHLGRPEPHPDRPTKEEK